MSHQEISARDFGLSPGETKDGSLNVLRALAACRRLPGAVLRFEPGVYHFRPEHAREALCWISNNDSGLKRIVFPLFGFDGLTIDGGGAEFVFHGALIPFVLDHSRHVTLRHFSIDWAEPVTLTGRVQQGGGPEVELALDPEGRYHLEKGRLTICGDGWETGADGFIELDAKTLAPAYRSGDVWAGGDASWSQSFAEAGPGRLRFTLPSDRRPLTPGNSVVFLRGDRRNPALFLTESAQVRLEDVNIYRATAMGVIAQRCEDVTLNRLNVQLRPGTDRVVTASADATHFVGCRGTITLTDCLFESQLDDPTNVHGIYTRVLQRLSDTELVVGRMHSQQKGVPFAGPGDRLHFAVPDTMNGLGERVVASVLEINATELLLTLTESLPEAVGAGFVAENLCWTPDVVIRNCTAQRNRARGFLISTPGRALVEGCTLSPGGAGILIPGESEFWFESGAVRDVTIRNNHFVDCGVGGWARACIDVTPHIPRLAERETPFHRNITIEGNRFDTFDRAVLAAWSVEGLTFRDNEITRTQTHPPFGAQSDTLEFRHCHRAVVEGNRLLGGAQPGMIHLDAETAQTARVSENFGLNIRGAGT